MSTSHASCNPRLRMLATWREAAVRAARRRVAACRVALARRTVLAPALPAGRRARAVERERRDIAGMGWRHPESLTRRVRDRYQRQLDARKAELWPADEYEMEL